MENLRPQHKRESKDLKTLTYQQIPLFQDLFITMDSKIARPLYNSGFEDLKTLARQRFQRLQDLDITMSLKTTRP